MMTETHKKSFLRFLILLLFLSCFLTTVRPHELQSRKLLLAREAADDQMLAVSKDQMQKSGWVHKIKERMDVEINDYPGSGANNRHDPRNPGRP
ncbi:hypothetical protein LUZ60_004021 [Juncus effusus]|nr:hypothetical protein LUZ60_004021 [Juncus effusus]